jgi:minimal PKS acyl carrier protein
MSSEIVADHELLEVLLAVGADRKISAADFDRSFEDLELDSLARAEFAAKLRDRSGVDTDEWATAEATPNKVRRIVSDHLSARSGR